MGCRVVRWGRVPEESEPEDLDGSAVVVRQADIVEGRVLQVF